MKHFFLGAFLFAQAVAALGQHCCNGDSAVREIQFPLTEKETETVFYYFNNEWLALPGVDIVETDSIQKFDVRNDEYGNRAVFFTVSPEYLAQLKAELRKFLINLDPRCEFPGGNGKLKEWLEANIRVPEGFKGQERVFVQFYVQSDGSVTDPKIVRKASKYEAVNAEALRLANTLPKFRVKYFTPKKHRLTYLMSVTFKEPGAVFIRGGEVSFIDQFPAIADKITKLYENYVFSTSKDSDFKISDICTTDFLQRLERANDSDTKGYATWLLRSGMQDGDDSESRILSIIPGADNTVIVHWSDMGHNGSTTFTMTEADGQWKITDATVPDGFNPL